MKRNITVAAMVLLAGSLFAADSSPKDDITSAAKKLAEKDNYSWRTTVVVPEDSPFKPGPTEGKTEKNGLTHVKMSFFDNTTQFVSKGTKAAIARPEGGWQSITEVENEEGPGWFIALIVRNTKNPSEQAAEIASYAKELKKEGDVYSGDLTEEGTKKLLTFRPREGDEAPTVSNAKGSVKFWLKDGALTRYEFKLKGSVTFMGNTFENDRATTVEIKDVGTTKLDVPEEAKKKLS